MKISAVRFAPWVGPQYVRGLGGLRILLVCESHYGARQHERPTVTAEIVKALALGEQHPLATKKLRRHPHFTKIMAAVTNARQGFTRAEKRDFWHYTAYYNFLQEFIPATRIQPSEAAWERGKTAFTEVLEVLAPELIVCLSLRTGRWLKPLVGKVPMAVVNHPSSRFAYSRVSPLIAEKKAQALLQKPQARAFTSSEAFMRWSEATASALPTPGPHLSYSDKTSLIEQRKAAMAMFDEPALEVGY